MGLVRSIEKFWAKHWKLRGIPEGESIIDKFYDVYKRAEKERKDLIKQTYEVDGKDVGMEYILNLKSRAIFPLVLQTASIAMANGRKNYKLDSDVSIPMFGCGGATDGDDFVDGGLRPQYFDNHVPGDLGIDELNTENIYLIISEEEKRLIPLAKEMKRFKVKGKFVDPVAFLNAALWSTRKYESKLDEGPEAASEIYKASKKKLIWIQAKTLYIGTLLARDDVESVRKELKKDGRSHVEGAIHLGNKLAMIGEANAKITYEMTRPYDVDDEKAKRIKKGLGLFYHGSTMLGQFTHDDSLSLKKDLENRDDNLWVLLSLEKYDSINMTSVKDYLKSKPEIVDTVLNQCLDEMREGYEILKEEDFAIEDLKLAIGYATRRAEKDMNKFEKNIIQMKLSAAWRERAAELRDHAGIDS
jgi:hypothetical protein